MPPRRERAPRRSRDRLRRRTRESSADSPSPRAGPAPNRSASQRRRLTDLSRIVTSACMPSAISAAFAPALPPPRMTTFAGATPGTPPSSLPMPPASFSRHFAPTCTAIRPATSLIGASNGKPPPARGDRFVGNGSHTRRHQRIGLGAIRRQVQIGEQNLARPQHRILGRLRLFDLHDQVGAYGIRSPHRARCVAPARW